MKEIHGNIVDIDSRSFFEGVVYVEDDHISRIEHIGPRKAELPYILPGFIDAHIHIESSMLMPRAFARMAVRQGCVGIVADPHEIANVLGVSGIEFMLEDSSKVNFHVCMMAPSCVPATNFETSGANLDASILAQLLERNDIYGLGEMMNYPGVLFSDPSVMAKLDVARKSGKPVDGHAPGLRGEDAKRYVSSGISSDHECTTLEEANERTEMGQYVLVREGSSAKNFEQLWSLVDRHPNHTMFCSDDKHPDDLLLGHINKLVSRAIMYGASFWNSLIAACVNPVRHYNMPIGCLRDGSQADFIVVHDISSMDVEATYIKGKCVYQKIDGKDCYPELYIDNTPYEVLPNRFDATPLRMEQIQQRTENGNMRVIGVKDGDLYTSELLEEPKVDEDGFVVSDTSRDILKMVVVNRYSPGKVSVGFIKGFKLKGGAIASTIAHDSHNLIAVGTNDDDILTAINHLIEVKGGIDVCYNGQLLDLDLPVAGLMSDKSGEEVAARYSELCQFLRDKGCPLHAPFMTLSFMSLLVIPQLKLGDRGLFDSQNFRFVNLFADK